MNGFASKMLSRKGTTRSKYPLRFRMITRVDEDYLSRKRLDGAEEFTWVAEAKRPSRSWESIVLCR